MSTVPFIKEFDPRYGQAIRLSPRVTRVVANNPGPFTFTGSATHLIGGPEGLAVIDPGPNDPHHIEAILTAATGPITDILITHTHLDHCGGTSKLKAATGATSWAFSRHVTKGGEAPPALDEGADMTFAPDRELTDGETVGGPNWTLEAVHTPGHIANHLCFALREEKRLFTGDHVMGWATTVVAPPDGSMTEYMDSLDRLLARPQDTIYHPTHGAPIETPHEFVKAIKAHRLGRDQAIIAALRTRALSLQDIVAEVYTNLDPRLFVAAGLNVSAHLHPHIEKGRVTEENGIFQLTQDGGHRDAD